MTDPELTYSSERQRHSGDAVRNGTAAAAGGIRDNSPAGLDRRLDQGLEETFPCSDPISVVIA